MNEVQFIFNEINEQRFDGQLPKVECDWMSPKEHKKIAKRIGLPEERVLFGFCYRFKRRIVVNKIIEKEPELVRLVMEHEISHLVGILLGIPQNRIDYMSGELGSKFWRYKLEFLRKYG